MHRGNKGSWLKSNQPGNTKTSNILPFQFPWCFVPLLDRPPSYCLPKIAPHLDPDLLRMNAL